MSSFEREAMALLDKMQLRINALEEHYRGHQHQIVDKLKRVTVPPHSWGDEGRSVYDQGYSDGWAAAVRECQGLMSLLRTQPTKSEGGTSP